MTTEQWQASRNNLKDAKRWVIKIGSALLTNDGKGLNREGMKAGVDRLLVCSMPVMKWCWSLQAQL